MEQREFGRLGRRASVVGLGTWQLGADWGEVGEEDAAAVLGIPYAEVMQAALIPVAYTIGTDFKPAPRADDRNFSQRRSRRGCPSAR